MTIEIGTSDFRTQAGQVPGIFIEPVKYYFDRLPDCVKENVAVSNFTGTTDVYYVHEAIIKANGLPQWLRGCNSIGEPHPTVIRVLKDACIGLHEITKEQIDVVRIKSIIDKHGVTEIDFLKVDTEGHDCVILNDYLDTVDIMPRKIQFEANELSDKDEVYKLWNRLAKMDYAVRKEKDDMICIYNP